VVQELREGRALPKQDLLSVFLTMPDEDGKFMADDVIKDNLLFVVTGGYETSSNTMANTLKFLAENPSILAEVLKGEEFNLHILFNVSLDAYIDILKMNVHLTCAEQSAIAEQKGEGLTWKDLKEMKYTWHVLQETTRLQPQVNAGFRVALEDIEYEGYTIPKGWKVLEIGMHNFVIPIMSCMCNS
jgi:cytochrome P450